MVQLQLLSKVIESGDYSIIEDNDLNVDYFVEYQDEFNFIKSHYDKYSKVPDKGTFLEKFDIELVDVQESDKYLLDTIREEYMYYQSVPIIQKAAKLLKNDANEAARYMIQEVSKLNPDCQVEGVDIISTFDERLKALEERRENPKDSYFKTGIKELDNIIHGLRRGEEFAVLVARISQGKSWILEKICLNVWRQGYNIGYISPEMSAISVGYRFDTLLKNFSNTGLMWGTSDVSIGRYEKYGAKLKRRKNKFVVATPKDFSRNITVSKLRSWVKKHKLDLLAIDGIKYLRDERAERGDNTTTTLTNISEDLMDLSVELGIPILIVVQANRGAINDGGGEVPDLEHIRDSDGIGANASTVLAIRQKDGNLELGVRKQRFGRVGDKLIYEWNIDTGEFNFIEQQDIEDNVTIHRPKERASYGDNDDSDYENVF